MSQAGIIARENNVIQGADQFVTDAGTAVPVAGVIDVFGGSGIATSASGKTITISLGAGTVSTDGNNCSFNNLAWSTSGGVLTIAGGDGTALSVGNPGYILMRSSQSGTTGQMYLFTITANQTLTVSDMTGNTLGTTAAKAWTSSLPLYVGFAASLDNATPEFFVTRCPSIDKSPASVADIGMPSSALADNSYSIFMFQDVTKTNFTGGETVGILGAVRATKDASDVWTISTAGSGTGSDIGKFLDSRLCEAIAGQNGASAGGYFKDNGGTAPLFTTQEYGYYIARNGLVTVSFKFNGDAGTDGAGAVDAMLALPIPCDDLTGLKTRQIGTAIINCQGIGAVSAIVSLDDDGTRTSATFRSTSTINLLNSDLSNGDRWIEGTLQYYTYKATR